MRHGIASPTIKALKKHLSQSIFDVCDARWRYFLAHFTQTELLFFFLFVNVVICSLFYLFYDHYYFLCKLSGGSAEPGHSNAA